MAAVLAKVPDCWAAIATAPGDDGVDFVSRFFAPAQGIPEDPATGSSHCTLVPYWAKRLGKNELEARQLSRRVGAGVAALRQTSVIIASLFGTFLLGERPWRPRVAAASVIAAGSVLVATQRVG